MQREIFVYDIETIPDADAIRRLLGDSSLDDFEARDALSQYFSEKTDGKNDFPRQPFHQVVAISYVHLTREIGEDGSELTVKRIATGGTSESSEAEMIEGFFNIIQARAPQLVSYNGRGFDMPVLKYRAMVHGLSCPRWFKEGDKWNNYETRYSHNYHLDLLETLSDFGASARCSMHEVASAFGIPGKLDTAGDDVRGMFEGGEIDAIRNYCETDVCTTALLMFRWMLFKGELSEGAYARAILGMRNYLESESDQRPHFAEYLNAWQDEN